MAEEFDIRSVWKKGKEKEDPSSLHITTLEKKGTKTTLYWIKTILWIEFWLSIIVLPPMVLFSFKQGDSYWLIGAYVLLTLIYLVYYQFLIRQIKRFNYDKNVLESLKKVYGYLRFFLLHYKVIFWISLITGFIYGLMDPANAEGLAKIETVRQLAITIIVWIILVALVGSLFHLILFLIYGKKVSRLRKMVKELESEQ
ncbi:hypothetical protein [Ekhidna sp.]|uniref:hypothetical protein n=1 Tax=Ekhidna sp. TaxID=2608089 RepID=UPI003B5B4E2F